MLVFSCSCEECRNQQEGSLWIYRSFLLSWFNLLIFLLFAERHWRRGRGDLVSVQSEIGPRKWKLAKKEDHTHSPWRRSVEKPHFASKQPASQDSFCIKPPQPGLLFFRRWLMAKWHFGGFSFASCNLLPFLLESIISLLGTTWACLL
jgi:hypothetical protein